jgi:hypothetical protein
MKFTALLFEMASSRGLRRAWSSFYHWFMAAYGLRVSAPTLLRRINGAYRMASFQPGGFSVLSLSGMRRWHLLALRLSAVLPERTFWAVVKRSSELITINKVIKSGDDPEGAVFEPVYFLWPEDGPDDT